MLTRRQFLGFAGGAAAVGAGGWLALVHDHVGSRPAGSASSSAASGGAGGEHVLVVVQLSGGNDSLNTVIPHDGRYHDLRPTLGITDDKLVALRGESSVGLHPSLHELGPLWDAGHLAIVPDVGFTDDGRSHFESLASWWSGDPDRTLPTGWLGRWLDTVSGEHGNPLLAVSLGGGATPALRALHAPSTSVLDLAGFALRAPNGGDREAVVEAFAATSAPAGTDPLLAAAQQAVASAHTSVATLAKLDTGSTSTVEGDAADDAATTGPITNGLASAAQLLALDVGTRVVVVSASGFDTHANEAATHERLLADLAHGVSSFFDALGKSGRGSDVVLVTTSEFGRRAQENGSGGTDHGHGAAHLVAGPAVRGGLNGSVDLGGLVDGDLPCALDTRSLYAGALDWLGGPTDDLLGAGQERAFSTR